ncbi:MAG: hypothetical protein MJ172_05080 [Clostridia bacterium]|nr:hypothetical protein [Clostridia bacterium]
MAQIVKCPNCTASLHFDAASGKVQCEYCGASFNVDELMSSATEADEKKLEDLASDKEQVTEEIVNEVTYEEEADDEEFKEEIDESVELNENEHQEFVCNNCGAHVIADRSTSATFCVFCGSPQVIQSRIEDKFKPRYIIPFKYTKEQAINGFLKWCKGGRFAPFGFVSSENINKITGIYVPFWLFDQEVHSDIHAESKHVKSTTTGNKETITTSTYDIKYLKKFKFSRVPLDGSSKLDDMLMEAIEPFNYEELKDFNPMYLAGYFAERYDLVPKDLTERMNKRSKEYVQQEFNEWTTSYGSVTSKTDNSVYLEPTAKYALLPVWFLHYKYLSKDYYFCMNGQTGEVAGILPNSRLKTTLIFFVLLAIFAVIARIILGSIIGGFVG